MCQFEPKKKSVLLSKRKSEFLLLNYIKVIINLKPAVFICGLAIAYLAASTLFLGKAA